MKYSTVYMNNIWHVSSRMENPCCPVFSSLFSTFPVTQKNPKTRCYFFFRWSIWPSPVESISFCWSFFVFLFFLHHFLCFHEQMYFRVQMSQWFLLVEFHVVCDFTASWCVDCVDWTETLVFHMISNWSVNSRGFCELFKVCNLNLT